MMYSKISELLESETECPFSLVEIRKVDSRTYGEGDAKPS